MLEDMSMKFPPKRVAAKRGAPHESQHESATRRRVSTPQRQMLPFTLRVANALVRAGITSIQHLCLFTVELLLQWTYQLGPKGVAEIKEVLAQEGKTLATTPPRNSERFFSARHLIQVVEAERLQEVEYQEAQHQELDPIVVADEAPASFVGRPPQLLFAAVKQGEGSTQGPVSADILLASLRSLIESIAALDQPPQEYPIEPPADAPKIEAEKLDLYQLWQRWLGKLNPVQQRILYGYYGLEGDKPLTLQELGEELEITRERVRQLKLRILRLLQSPSNAKAMKQLRLLFTASVQQTNGLLTVEEWERWIDEQSTWKSDEPKPMLLPLLCELYEGYSFENTYQVACDAYIGNFLKAFEGKVRHLLRRHKSGLTADELVALLPPMLEGVLPAAMREPSFILKAVTLFDRITQGADGRYHYHLRKVKSHFEKVGRIWLGEPGTRLYEWECKLRE